MASLEHAEAEINAKKLQGMHVSFSVGGEPTYEWDTFRWFVEACDQTAERCGVPIYKAITTNGFYLEETRDFLSSEFDHVLLSIDGPAEIQNKQRPAPGGAPSYPTVFESGKHFSQHARGFSVRATVSSDSVRFLSDLVQFFVGSFGAETDIVLEPLVEIGRALSDLSASPPPPIRFASALWDAMLYGDSVGANVSSSCFNARRIVRTFCQAVAMPAFVVTTSGLVTICARDADGTDYSFGEYDGAIGRFVLDQERLAELRKLAILPQRCYDCIAKWHCAGDCPDTRVVGIERCETIRLLLVWHLQRLAEQGEPI